MRTYPSAPPGVSRPPKTNSDRSTPSRRSFRSGNVPKSAFLRRFVNFWGCPKVIIPQIITPGPSTTLPQPPGRYPAHSGPIMTSQLLLEGNLSPRTCQIGFSAPFFQLLGMSQSDFAAYYHPEPKYQPPTTSGGVSRPLRTYSGPSAPSRR